MDENHRAPPSLWILTRCFRKVQSIVVFNGKSVGTKVAESVHIVREVKSCGMLNYENVLTLALGV